MIHMRHEAKSGCERGRKLTEYLARKSVRGRGTKLNISRENITYPDMIHMRHETKYGCKLRI